MNTKKRQEVRECHHCGNETLMNQELKRYFEIDEHCPFSIYHVIFSCPVCDSIMLVEQLYFDDNYPNEREIQEKILYPNNNFFEKNNIEEESIPENILKSYKSALKVKKVDNTICLIAIRRTLEQILNHLGATGKNLYTKIKNLSEQNILPKQLENASNITRLLGNEAAHGCDVELEINNNEIEEIFSILEAIINYVFVLPTKIKYYDEKISNLKTQDSNQKS